MSCHDHEPPKAPCTSTNLAMPRAYSPTRRPLSHGASALKLPCADEQGGCFAYGGHVYRLKGREATRIAREVQMSTTEPALSAFPSPYSVQTPPGCEGWEEMYPY